MPDTVYTSPKLIDTINDTHATELLRREVMKNSIMARSLNIDKVFWHAGWVTGDVLRFTYSDAALEKHIQKVILVQAREFSISIETSAYIAGLNLTRGLIEGIVKAARNSIGSPSVPDASRNDFTFSF